MTIDVRLALLLAVALSGCPLEPPPEPRDIDCAEIDRAPERFPDECGDAAVDSGGE